MSERSHERLEIELQGMELDRNGWRDLALDRQTQIQAAREVVEKVVWWWANEGIDYYRDEILPLARAILAKLDDDPEAQ